MATSPTSRTVAAMTVTFMLVAVGSCGSPGTVGDPGFAQQQVPRAPGWNIPGDDLEILQGLFANYADHPCDSSANYYNEVHDCQRLVVNGSTTREFGPLVGIIPEPSIVEAKDSISFTTPRLVASIVNWGVPSPKNAQIGYATLSISRGSRNTPSVQCLWLWRRGDTWDAALTAPTRDRSDCLEQEAPAAGSASWDLLRVVRQRFRNLPLSEYPGTARWQWTDEDYDARVGEHYIGIRCNAGWCAIGQQGSTAFRPDPALAVQKTHDRSIPDSRAAIPGWFDGQFLAVRDRNDELVPGPWGFVFPIPISALLTEVQPSAKLVMKDAGGKRGDPKDSEAPKGNVSNNPYHPASYATRFHLGAERTWPWKKADWTSTVHASVSMNKALFENRRRAPLRRRNATFHFDPAHEHSATNSARFRWRPEDESVWISCRSGCCDVGFY